MHEATNSPVAAEALRRIAELYAIEATIRSQTGCVPAGRAAHQVTALVEAMKIWLEAGFVAYHRAAAWPMQFDMR